VQNSKLCYFNPFELFDHAGSWVKYRLNRGQELVVGGYVPGTHGLDSIIVGYYKGQELNYVARVRNGFVPDRSRPQLEHVGR
jgi:bifunctional non-homologous end joining protein LigD